MAAKLETVVSRWLDQMKTPVAFSFVRDKLLTHPDYPSIASVTDTLDDLGIPNAALVIDKSQIAEVPLPFLAHTGAHGGEFVIVSEKNRRVQNSPGFNRDWDGIVVVAERPDKWLHAENEERLSARKRAHLHTGIAAIVMTVLILLLLRNQPGWPSISLLALTALGLVASIFIIQREMGINNQVADRLCRTGKNTDCEAVVNARGARIVEWLDWSDLGIIYFSSFAILLATGLQWSLLGWMALAAIPFTFFSVYYQGRVLKKWCTLCLITVVVLWLEFIVLLPVLAGHRTGGFPFSGILQALFTGALVTGTWYLVVKPALNDKKSLLNRNYALQRLKNTPEVFDSLLRQQRQVDTTPFPGDLQLGNPNAAVQIMVACSLYCGPCAKAHNELDRLLESNDVGLTVRFAVNTKNHDEQRIHATAYLLQLMRQKNRADRNKVLHDWYALRNFEKFVSKYPADQPYDEAALLEPHERWTEKSAIVATPTLFLNGYELPPPYEIADLAGVIKGLSKLYEGNTLAVNQQAIAK